MSSSYRSIVPVFNVRLRRASVDGPRTSTILCRSICSTAGLKHQRLSSASITSATTTDVNRRGGHVTDFNAAYREMLNERVCQARRSVLVFGNVHQSAESAVADCLGADKRCVVHPISSQHFLMELDSESDVDELMRRGARHLNHSLANTVPTKMRYLSLLRRRAAGTKKRRFSLMKEAPDAANILQQCSSLKNQMQSLSELWTIDDTTVRMAFFASTYIQDAMSGIFPDCSVLPFGSCVNGFGKPSSDIDLRMRLDERIEDEKDVNENGLDWDVPFAFMGKQIPRMQRGNHRTNSGAEQSQEFAKHIFTALRYLFNSILPGVIVKQMISQARVPLIRFGFHGIDIDYDFSVATPGHNSQDHMTKFLWMLVHFDDRIKPLVLALQYWAKQVGLARVDETQLHLLSSFQVTTFVLHFLQNTSPPILPPLGKLFASTEGPELEVVGSESMRALLAASERNRTELDDLFAQFMDYYANLNIDVGYELCLMTGQAQPLRSGRLVLYNPFESHQNMLNSIGTQIPRLLRTACAEAATILRNEPDVRMPAVISSTVKHRRPRSRHLADWQQPQSWGLTRLCQLPRLIATDQMQDQDLVGDETPADLLNPEDSSAQISYSSPEPERTELPINAERERMYDVIRNVVTKS